MLKIIIPTVVIIACVSYLLFRNKKKVTHIELSATGEFKQNNNEDKKEE